MKILLLISILLSGQVFAGDLVLMTSLTLKPKQLRSLEEKFAKKLSSSGHKLVIHHDTTPLTLYQVMTSEETLAVIWVSHAAAEKKNKKVTGQVADSVIVDNFGNNVKNFFTLIPSQLQYLAIVGCEANSIIEGFRSRGNYVGQEHLTIRSFDKKVVMQKAFKQVLEEISQKLNSLSQMTKNNPQPEGVKWFISRDSEAQEVAASWVEVGDKVLNVFDENELTAKEGSLTVSQWSALTNKNIKHVRIAKGDKTNEDFGRLTLQTYQPVGQWKLFELKGKVLSGRNQQLYVYKNP